MPANVFQLTISPLKTILMANMAMVGCIWLQDRYFHAFNSTHKWTAKPKREILRSELSRNEQTRKMSCTPRCVHFYNKLELLKFASSLSKLRTSYHKQLSHYYSSMIYQAPRCSSNRAKGNWTRRSKSPGAPHQQLDRLVSWYVTWAREIA